MFRSVDVQQGPIKSLPLLGYFLGVSRLESGGTLMKLTETKVKNTKPDLRPKRLADGRGLYLYVPPTGGKLWRSKYRYQGKEKLMSFGRYPDVSWPWLERSILKRWSCWRRGLIQWNRGSNRKSRSKPRHNPPSRALPKSATNIGLSVRVRVMPTQCCEG